MSDSTIPADISPEDLKAYIRRRSESLYPSPRGFACPDPAPAAPLRRWVRDIVAWAVQEASIGRA